MTSIRMAILAGVVLASWAGAVAGAPPGSPWQPPANADEILRYRIQEGLRSRLRETVIAGKSTFERNVRELGKRLYDSGVTAEELQRLVDEVIKKNGKKNPTVDYQADLKAVVEAAAKDLLGEKYPDAMREYVLKDLIQKMVTAVAIQGMDEVAHLATLSEMDREEVIDKAHEEAKRRYRAAIRRARDEKKQIEDPNGLWKTIQLEEFNRAARDWMFKTLQKNWGIQLPYGDPGRKTVEEGIGRRVGQLGGFEQDLTRYIEEEIQDIIAGAGQSKVGEKEMRKQLKELFDEIRAGVMKIGSRDESKMVAKVREQMGIGKEGDADETEPSGGGAIASQPTSPPPANPARGTSQAAGSKPNPIAPARNTSGGTSRSTPSREEPQGEPYPCQFLIELKMKQADMSDAVITVHLCKGSGPGDGIQREGVMPPKEITVRAFTEIDIEAAATAIQEILESRDGMNLCVDQAQALALRNRSTMQVPPVQLNCYLRMYGRVFGPIWSDAVKKGVENTATNVNWNTVTIKFVSTL